MHFKKATYCDLKATKYVFPTLDGLFKIEEFISFQSSMAVTAGGPPIFGTVSFPKLLSPSICYKLPTSIQHYRHTTNSSETSTSIGPQWLHLEPRVSYSKRRSSISAPGLTMASTDGTSALPPNTIVTHKTLTLSLFFLPNSICQRPQPQIEQL